MEDEKHQPSPGAKSQDLSDAVERKTKTSKTRKA